jgi:hypothetical protein
MGGIKDLIIDDGLLDIIADLVFLSKHDYSTFLKTYPNIPFNYYYTIEELATMKSTINKEICDKARLISSTYHKSIK